MLGLPDIATLVSSLVGVTSLLFYIIYSKRVNKRREELNKEREHALERLYKDSSGSDLYHDYEVIDQINSYNLENYDDLQDEEKKILTHMLFTMSIENMRESKDEEEFNESFKTFAHRLREKNAEELDLSINQIEEMSLEEIRDKKEKIEA